MSDDVNGYADSVSERAVAREKPMLFSAAMVRAILAGRKTQTRRVAGLRAEDCPLTTQRARYRVGDRLWVRETWCQPEPDAIAYRADLSRSALEEECRLKRAGHRSDVPWRPSIFMPRWASRITLEVTAVRVQQLREISDDDVAAEGVGVCADAVGEAADGFSAAQSVFAEQWNGINGKRPRCSWADNPHVWVINFKRLG